MRNLLLIFLFSAISYTTFAQKDVDFDRDPSFMDRVYFGGGVGFSSDYNATFISVSPIVGYMITQNLSAGVGVQYQYIKYKYSDLSGNTYGGNIFTRYNIRQFFIQGEYNLINIAIGNNLETRRNYERLLFGGGITQPLGRKFKINAVGMYDVIYNVNSPFASPWVFRVYISR